MRRKSFKEKAGTDLSAIFTRDVKLCQLSETIAFR